LCLAGDIKALWASKNQLQAIALKEGVRRKKGLWSKQGRTQFEKPRRQARH